ncbi:hypothetical protein QL285_014115 [Trifolium repens]|nr:hypothetical protein QL285_014115 [Trifolium repens]
MGMGINIPPWGRGWRQKFPRKQFGAGNGDSFLRTFPAPLTSLAIPSGLMLYTLSDHKKTVTVVVFIWWLGVFMMVYFSRMDDPWYKEIQDLDFRKVTCFLLNSRLYHNLCCCTSCHILLNLSLI